MFSISESPDVNAMFRVVLEAKFHENPEDDDIPASALVAALAIELRNCLRAKEVEREGMAAERRWEEWLAITATRREWRCAMAYAAGHWKEWPSWTEDAKEVAVRQLLSPFEVSPETIAAFRQDLERGW